MHQLSIRFFVVLICFLFCANLSAQEAITYTTKQGLPSNHIYDVTQDSNGFMWFATNRGVVKFDGVAFKTFTVKDGLPNNDTWKLESDFQGRVWYFSKSNYQGYIQNDSVYKFIVQDSAVINPNNISVSKDNVWMDLTINNPITLKDNQLESVFTIDSKRLDNFIKKQLKPNQLPVTQPFIRLNPSLGHYVVILNKELFVLDKDMNILFVNKHDLPNMYRSSSPINKSGAMPNQTFYLTTGEGILLINHKTKFSKYYKYEGLLGHKKIIEVYCNGIFEEIQFSTEGYLLRFDYDLNLIENISFPQSIPNHRSYKDRDGNIWSINLGKGITFQPNTLLQNKYYLLEKNIQKIGLLDESLLVGIIGEGFFEYMEQKDNFVKRVNQKFGKIYQISYNKNSQRGYLATDYAPIVYENDSFKSFIFNGKNGAKYLKQFKDFLYILTSSNLIKRNLKTETRMHLEPRRGLIIAEVHQNRLYIGASDGLYILQNDVLIKPEIKEELLNMPILSFLSAEEYLIVGTDGRGIYLFGEDEIIHLRNTEDLSIQRIIKKEHALWVGTQKGVLKVDLDTNNLEDSKITNAFFEEDGLLQNNTNDIYLEGKALYAASDKGLAKLDLSNDIYQKKPKLYFKTAKDTLKYSGSERDNISIAFSVMDYVSQENYRYEYRLLPNQKEWTSTTTQAINFSSLSPNFYTLKVKVTDHHGNQSIKNQYIEIVPAWYQTNLAKVGFTILSIILMSGVFKMIQLRIQRKEQLKVQQEKRLAGLELQALRSQMNPHFVHNSLNAILYYIQRSEKELSEKYLVKFSKLIRLFFEYSRKQNIAIKNEIDLLNYYLQVEKLRFEDKLLYEINVDEKIDVEEYLIPSMILQPIVENAVNHGLFHKPGVGRVQINFIYLNNIAYKVTIKDDGIGIDKSKEIFMRSSKSYQSRSTNVLNERLALLKQSKEWDIIYSIEDLSKKSETTGTIVTLTFKQSNN